MPLPRPPPVSCCLCQGLARTSKCLTPSCPRSVWTSLTSWMTVRTQVRSRFCSFLWVRYNRPPLQLCGSAASVRVWRSGSACSATRTQTSLLDIWSSTAKPATLRYDSNLSTVSNPPDVLLIFIVLNQHSSFLWQICFLLRNIFWQRLCLWEILNVLHGVFNRFISLELREISGYFWSFCSADSWSLLV